MPVPDLDYAIIGDIPTPWREPVFERVYDRLSGNLQVVYFKDNEKRRLWSYQMGAHPKKILKALTITWGVSVSTLLDVASFSITDGPAV